MSIPISKIKALREQLGATHLVAFVITPDGQQHVLTHGETEVDAVNCAGLGNRLKEALQWPDSLCNAKPLERICQNCTYFKDHAHSTGYRRIYGGKCMLEPVQVNTKPNDKCRHFQPNPKL